MAKNITLMGADYPDVPAVQLPMTGGGTATFYDIELPVSVANGGTGATTAKDARTNLGAALVLESPASIQTIIDALPNTGNTAVVTGASAISSALGTSGTVYGVFCRASSSRIDFQVARQTGLLIVGKIELSGSSYTITTHKLDIDKIKGNTLGPGTKTINAGSTAAMMFSGHITGSGNYIDVFIPINCADISGITSVTLGSTSTLYTANTSASMNSVQATTVSKVDSYGIFAEFPTPSTLTNDKNKVASLRTSAVTIVCT